jgi:hypothetical protein
MTEIAYLKRIKLITAYNIMALERVEVGWQPYFVTYVFRHIPGGQKNRTEIMTSEVCRVYSQMLTRIIHNPNSPSWQHLLPYLVASPDLPVPKSGIKATLRELTINGGLHFHGLFLLPPEDKCRLGRQLLSHYEKDKQRYCPTDHPLLRMDIRPSNTAMLADYTLKPVKRGNVAYEDILILPRSSSETKPSNRKIET